jgi:hypothetical protein
MGTRGIIADPDWRAPAAYREDLVLAQRIRCALAHEPDGSVLNAVEGR